MTRHLSTVNMTKEQWLEARKDTIGSSDIGAIAGLNKYQTAREVYKTKKGLTPAFEGNDSTEWGTELEDFCARMFERKNPDLFPEGRVEAIAPHRIQRDNKIRIHPSFPWAAVNIDRLIVGGKQVIILELKTTTSFAVQNWDAEVPTSYYAQVQWQMFVSGYEKAIIWVAVLDTKKFIRLDVDYNPDFAKVLLDKAAEFMAAMDDNDIDRLPLELADVEKAEAVEGSQVQVTEEIAGKVSELTDIKDRISMLEKMKEWAEGKIKLFIGENQKLVDGDRVLATYSTIEKGSYVVQAKKYRMFKLQREKTSKKGSE